jgi:hypothetical protein
LYPTLVFIYWGGIFLLTLSLDFVIVYKQRMEETMNQNEALNVLVQAVNVAQSKGAYSLQEAAVITEAVSTFISTDAVLPAATEEPAETKKTSNKK